MIQDYIKERYGEGLEVNWKEYLERHQLKCHKTYYGFVTYKLQGDAALLYDLYVKPTYRKHTYGWLLHDHVISEARNSGKYVAITFSEFKGINHMAGIKAIQLAGFSPAFKTNKEFVFVKGI